MSVELSGAEVKIFFERVAMPLKNVKKEKIKARYANKVMIEIET